MGPTMAVLTGVKPGTGQRADETRLSWPVFLLTLAAVTSSSLSALSLHQLIALRAEVDALKSEVIRRREERHEANSGGQDLTTSAHPENISGRRNSQEPLQQSAPLHAFTRTRRGRSVPGADSLVSQPCLHLLANASRKPFRRDLTSEPSTGIPWQTGLKRGTALEAAEDKIYVREEGFYFVYSQVYYKDSTFAMGHVVIRWKRNVVGIETQEVTLFRCIQNMNPVYPYNTCYTGGIVKLDLGDHLELLIPRSTANVSLDGDSSFLGAFKLA